MKKNMFVALLVALTLATGTTAAAQPAPYNEIGLTMGHWHLISKDVEANKKIFLAMGGKLYMPGGNPLIMFPGLYINLNLQAETGDGATGGSVVNHVGFIVDNVQQRVAEWRAAGVTVLPGIPGGAAGDGLGQEVDLTLKVALKDWKFQAGYSHFFAGEVPEHAQEFIVTNLAGDDSGWGYLMATVEF